MARYGIARGCPFLWPCGQTIMMGMAEEGSSRHALRIPRRMPCPPWRWCTTLTLRMAMGPRCASPIVNRATAWIMGDASMGGAITTHTLTDRAVTEDDASRSPADRVPSPIWGPARDGA